MVKLDGNTVAEVDRAVLVVGYSESRRCRVPCDLMEGPKDCLPAESESSSSLHRYPIQDRRSEQAVERMTMAVESQSALSRDFH